jgi:alkylhydroperoxidase/carboxymuconolactone decarboxylase family protein YurZ
MNTTHSTLKTLGTLSIALAALATPAGARADTASVHAEITKAVGFVPSFVKALPANLLPGVWQEMRDFEMNDKTALSSKTKDLIGLAIAAQMPSRLTVWSYGKCAKANGATEGELKEAVAKPPASFARGVSRRRVTVDTLRAAAERAGFSQFNLLCHASVDIYELRR